MDLSVERFQPFESSTGAPSESGDFSLLQDVDVDDVIGGVDEEIEDDYDYGNLDDELEALREEDERERNRVVQLPSDPVAATSGSTGQGPMRVSGSPIQPRTSKSRADQPRRRGESGPAIGGRVDAPQAPGPSSSVVSASRGALGSGRGGGMNEASLESTVVENYTDEFYADDIDELVIDGLEASRSPPRQLSQLSRHQQIREGQQHRAKQRKVRVERHDGGGVSGLDTGSMARSQQQVEGRGINKENMRMNIRSRSRVVQQQTAVAVQQEQRRQQKLKALNNDLLGRELRKHQSRKSKNIGDLLTSDDEVSIGEYGDGDESSELSSGLGYTTPRPPDSNRKPGDAMEFQRAIAHGTDAYVAGNFTDLPVRIAYEQLHSLEAMNRKVQKVIEHNAEIFGRKVRSLDMRLMKRVLDDWRAIKVGGHEKKMLMARLLRRYFRKTLFKAFNAWRLKHGRAHDPSYAMLKKATRVVTMGMQRRCFNGWFNVFQESVREAVLMLREQRTREETEARHNMRQLKRAERCYRKKKLYAVWVRLDKNVDRRIAKRNKMRRVLLHFQNKLMARAFVSWYERFDFKREQRRKVKNAVMRIKKGATARALLGWQAAVLELAAKRRKVNRALARLKNRMLGAAFLSWESYLDLLRRQRQFALKMLMPYRYNGFHGWHEWLVMRKRNRLIVSRCLARLKFRNLMRAWNHWITFVTTTNEDRQLSTMSGLREKLEQVMRDNHQLRKDNERFVKLIDSGEWGRTRVKELSQAGEVLKGERDALQKLIANLRLEHDNVKLQQQRQETELRRTKDRILSGNFVQRNKLIVKGGSSFNGLVRAMKADMLDTSEKDAMGSGRAMPQKKDRLASTSASRNDIASGATASSSGAAQPGGDTSSMLYAVDRLSMQKVSVFPDGELNVQAINPDGTEPFRRSTLKARSARPREAVREKFVQSRSSRLFDAAGDGPAFGLTDQEQSRLKAIAGSRMKNEKNDQRVSGMASSMPETTQHAKA